MDKNKVLLPNEIFDLAVKNHQKNKLKISENLYNKVLEINPNDTSVNYNLGKLYTEIKEYQKAISCYEKTVKINPNYINAYYNLGLLFKLLGKFQKAIECFEKVIEIDPNNVQAYNNCAVLLGDTVDLIKAKKYLKKAISIDPKNLDLYWNLHGQASNIDEALEPLEELNKINNNYPKAKIMISALNVYKGNFDLYKDLLSSANSNHAHTRSIKWVFSLPNLPKIFFNRLEFFDAIIPLTEISRPFYEFGVWNGESFKYLINSYKKGFGFDTFDGLPETWHNSQPKGAYSSFGAIPKIEGGQFVVGKFEDTLSEFFLKKRPIASLINFDADLYSSTLCALNNSKNIIDEKTVLIFDEFLMNKNWEKDEYRALNDFCKNQKINYEVLAVSFFTKQVAIKLKW